jgi:hypothetical protein
MANGSYESDGDEHEDVCAVRAYVHIVLANQHIVYFAEVVGLNLYVYLVIRVTGMDSEVLR